MFGIGGQYPAGYGPFGNSNNKTTVFYFQRSSEKMALDVADMASKILSVTVAKPKFVDVSSLDKDMRFVIENSGLDLQLFLVSPR
jgi:hypothetical protein